MRLLSLLIFCFSLVASGQNSIDSIVCVESAIANVDQQKIEIDEPLALHAKDSRFYELLRKRGVVNALNSSELFNSDYCSFLQLKKIDFTADSATVTLNIVHACDEQKDTEGAINVHLIKRNGEWIVV